ncbi:putative glycolipid-binding domain-containing protein [Hoeflea sp. WL0058]|uniref:Glycolipid-binding domain-containing protein n=1 Tax=Flavimaribacter sediminis TaxID=2865987 RepID=A0AAE2ZLI0_9HYPH|nr:putative glycolipid-binding domain-containing protein [Flavimaribacter sediminis]MBW8636655.1 putative glycolipid-binding domain-containing protein [Flavimaribacter sediminis]
MADRDRLPRAVLWRRFDPEGMDACRYARSGDGYEISGTALYHDRHGPAKLDYQVLCNADWSSRSARVSGWRGSIRTDLLLSRSAEGSWTTGGAAIPGVDGLADIDLGFTPATNANAIRRLGLETGAEAETTAVWLDVDDWRFKPLRQIYSRLSETRFAYSSPQHGYDAVIVTDDFGVVRSYPELWEAVA